MKRAASHSPDKTRQISQNPQAGPNLSEPIGFPVVGIGASAGGLEAFRRFLDAQNPATGMAFVLIQHLDPTHPSLMAELLSTHTSMPVAPATHGMLLKPEHVYLIPPGVFLAIQDGVLRLSKPKERHGARLPFDFFLSSLADDRGRRAVCVVLSGTGADGSKGLVAIKNKGGFVIVQDPEEASFDGMPKSAIATGEVDLVARVDDIPAMVMKHFSNAPAGAAGFAQSAADPDADAFVKIIGFVRDKTSQDFSVYKKGTLERRLCHRMSAARIEDRASYLTFLRKKDGEAKLLRADLLIGVTQFFRGPTAFEFLAKEIIPALIKHQSGEQLIRVWCPGCSTGEEPYSIAMLFFEAFGALKRPLKLQIFASDVNEDAVAFAREGIYSDTIKADVSPERLTRFFIQEEHSCRVVRDLRDAVVFTVHDVLADPPFSGIDLVCCRNLLIYLQPQAQYKILSFFHFALRDRGVLFLGGSEAVGSEERFEAISKKHRIYRHVGRSLPGEIAFPTRPDASGRSLLAAPATPVLGQAFNFADLSQRALFDAFELSSALIDVNHECLHFSGRADKYLQITAGDASRDILAMVRDGLRPKLRAAIERASRDHARTTVNDAYLRKDGRETPIGIIVEPVTMGPKGFLLVSFLNHPFERPKADRAPDSDRSRAADAEREIQDLHHELKNALYELDNAKAEEKRIQEQAMSLNEEAQSTNEELVTSKEELQSLNEELTALNNQLQESLERQRNTSNDLQNILESSGIATIFLDRALNIRFFTPAAKTQFRIISADIGRPLADFTSLTSDRELIPDALQVLSEHLPIEREVPAQDAVWYRRLILPYRTQEGSIEGVVITFMDITENRRAAEALAGARQTADRANLSKSRFLAAASHDLRQPLQTILLIQGLLSTRIKETEAQKLLKRLDASVSVMSGMLNTLLDINQLEAGVIQPEIENFPLNGVFEHLKADFSFHMEAQGLSWRVLQSKCVVRSDPRLLEQIVRNLLANAVKFTSKGKVLLGCRRHKEMMHIEVWDTGPGIPDEHRRSIFEEFHQVDNPARERSKGLGLGLAIVERLSHLLGHAIDVRSQVGRGSMFSIAVPFQPGASDAAMHGRPKPPLTQAQAHATILMIDDDPTIRELLDMLLLDAGYRSISVSDGAEAFASSDRPDLIIADFNLPNGPNGVDIVAKIREKFNNAIPAIVLTGDISTATLGAIARQGCTHVDKPVDAAALLRAITHLLASSSPIPSQPESKAITTTPSLTIFVVDDDAAIRDAVRDMMEANGWSVETFENCKAFLKALRPGLQGCLVVDAMLPGMDGFDLLARLKSEEIALPSIMITGHGDIAMAVRAMRDGASDFLEKPFSAGELIASINQALGQNRKPGLTTERHADAVGRLAGLTPRQHQILALVLAGQPSKNIASDLGLSQRTVENHRAAIMRKTGSRSIPALIRIAVAAN